jgi:hypothetical protein
VNPIIPIVRREPFDDPAWLFELKYDGFRGIADTIGGLSKNKNRLRRFDRLLEGLPEGYVFDGECPAATRRWWRPSRTGCAAIRVPSSKIRTSSASVCTSTTRFRVASGTL